MQINPKLVIEQRHVYCDSSPITDEQISSNGIDLRINEDVVIQPGKFKNVQLMESFNLKGVFSAIWIRSSLSRKGIFQSSGLFDDNFCGIGGISLYNMSEHPITITKGTRICQMVFFKSDPAKLYNGFYNQNTTIQSQFNTTTI